jgi:hypothetical protein
LNIVENIGVIYKNRVGFYLVKLVETEKENCYEIVNFLFQLLRPKQIVYGQVVIKILSTTQRVHKPKLVHLIN